MDRVSARLAESARALGVNLRSSNLRYAQASFGAAWASEWAGTVALGVVAFRAGGAAEVGLFALLRMLPSALVAPLGTAVADRMDRGGVLAASGAVRAVALNADRPPARAGRARGVRLRPSRSGSARSSRRSS